MDNLVLNITSWFLGIATWISLLVIICGGIKYFLARGNKGKEKRAGKIFVYGLIILFISAVLFAVLFPTGHPV